MLRVGTVASELRLRSAACQLHLVAQSQERIPHSLAMVPLDFEYSSVAGAPGAACLFELLQQSVESRFIAREARNRRCRLAFSAAAIARNADNTVVRRGRGQLWCRSFAPARDPDIGHATAVRGVDKPRIVTERGHARLPRVLADALPEVLEDVSILDKVGGGQLVRLQLARYICAGRRIAALFEGGKFLTCLPKKFFQTAGRMTHPRNCPGPIVLHFRRFTSTKVGDEILELFITDCGGGRAELFTEALHARVRIFGAARLNPYRAVGPGFIMQGALTGVADAIHRFVESRYVGDVRVVR